MIGINSPRPPPTPSTSRTLSANALDPLQEYPSITAADLPGLLDSLGIKPDSISDGKPTYKLDREELGMLLKNPAVKSDMASFVMAMMDPDPSGPIIELEPDAAAIIGYYLGRQETLPGFDGDSNAPVVAFKELIKQFADQEDGEHYQRQMQYFYNDGKKLENDMPMFNWPGRGR